jgi:hypothetical protein
VRRLEVVPLAWDEPAGFREWFRTWWEPGQHGSVIAPTGEGKTTFVGGILRPRRYVLVLDPKGGDSTLGALGFQRLESWPGNRQMAALVARNDEDGKPSRYIVGPKVLTRRDKLRLIQECKRTLNGAYEMGRWTIYGDELQILTDPRMFDLRAEVDEILIAARDKMLSFVSSYQGPSWVTPHASRQSTWVAIAYTRDTDVVNRLAEIMGRPKPEIRGCVDGLDRFCYILVGRNPREPLRVTLPSEILVPGRTAPASAG